MITDILMRDTLTKLFPQFNESFRTTEGLARDLATIYYLNLAMPIATLGAGLNDRQFFSATTDLEGIMTRALINFYTEYQGRKMDVMSIINKSISRLLARRCVLVMKALEIASKNPDHPLHGLIANRVENARLLYTDQSAILSIAMQPFLIALKKPYSTELNAQLEQRFESDILDAAHLKDAPSKTEEYSDAELVLDLVFNAALLRIRSNANEALLGDVQELLKIRAGAELH